MYTEANSWPVGDLALFLSRTCSLCLWLVCSLSFASSVAFFLILSLSLSLSRSHSVTFPFSLFYRARAHSCYYFLSLPCLGGVCVRACVSAFVRARMHACMRM